MFTSQKAFMKLIVSDVSTPLFCRAHNESLANNFSWIICCMNPTPFPAGRSHEYCAIPSIYSVLPKLMEICCSQLALLGWKVRYKTSTASSWLLHQTFPSFGGERQLVCYPGEGDQDFCGSCSLLLAFGAIWSTSKDQGQYLGRKDPNRAGMFQLHCPQVQLHPHPHSVKISLKSQPQTLCHPIQHLSFTSLLG